MLSGSDIYLLDAVDGQVTLLPSITQDEIIHLSLARDDSFVVFTTDRDEADLWMMELPVGNP